jgi:hypothetical protein
MLLVSALVESFRQELFEHFLADLLAETSADDADGRLAGAEAGQVRFLLDVGDDALGLALYLVYGHLDFERVLTTFKYWHGSRRNEKRRHEAASSHSIMPG